MRATTGRKILGAALTVLGLAGVALAGDGLLERLEKEVQDVAGRAGPAVVKVTAHFPSPVPVPGLDLPDPLEALLARSSPVGTGFLASVDGLVVTTHRIAQGADTAQVEFPNGLVREGEILGSDAFYQIAVLRVDPVEDVAPLPLEEGQETGKPRLGVFLGNSYGTARNVSLGVVTPSTRPPDSPAGFDNYLVMNAPIHPGDEGGPLVGPKGEVVAVGAGRFTGAVSISMGSGGARFRLHGFDGSGDLGLLVPASDVRFAIGEIERHGRVPHGKLGIYLRPKSLEIREVQPDTPAEEAGLAPGDVILKVDDRPIRGAAEFRFRLRRISIDASVRIGVRRGDETVTVTSGLADLGERTTIELLPGVHVLIQGPPVVAVVEGRPEPRPGDRIVSVNGVPVATVGEARQSLSKDRSPRVHILVDRGGKRVELEIPR